MDMIGELRVAATGERARLALHILLKAVSDQLQFTQMMSFMFV